MSCSGDGPPAVGGERAGDGTDPAIVIASLLPPEGITGVHTHVRQLRQYLLASGMPVTLVTPFSWGGHLAAPVFGLRRLALQRCCRPAGVLWYQHWHEVFLRNALRRCLARTGECVVYAQDPLAARAALAARSGPQQRVTLAVHFRISEADEWADKRQIKRGGPVFRAIRRSERRTIPGVDDIVYVSGWGRRALLDWLPEAAAVPSIVIGNFVARLPPGPELAPLGDLVTTGSLEIVKNHRFLLTVLAQARRAGRRLTLDVFGDGPCRQDLQRLARALGLADQVRFRGFQPDVRRFLPRYRAYVHASYSESLPLAIIEAMAAGLPVLAGDIGGIHELCEDGVEGRFWSLSDPTLAAATLIGLLDREPARLAAAHAARRRFDRDFSADVIAPRLCSFLLARPLAAQPARAT